MNYADCGKAPAVKRRVQPYPLIGMAALLISILFFTAACGRTDIPEVTPTPSAAEATESADSVSVPTSAPEASPSDAPVSLSCQPVGITYYRHDGGFYNTAGEWVKSAEHSSKHTNMLKVSPGDRFSYTGLGNANAASVIWYDSAHNFLVSEQYGQWPTPAAVIVTAPPNAAYVQFSSFYSIHKEVALEVFPVEKVSPDLTPLANKKIVYDGDSICFGSGYPGGYARLIALLTGGSYDNQAKGGARLITQLEGRSYHSVVDNLPNLPTDGDLYCFEGGINDYWTDGVALGTYDDTFDGELDTTTVCGALETIFRYSLEHFPGKPICFVIVHKIQSTAYKANEAGHTFEDYHDAMVGICQKYSIPYYDAFYESGLNGWNKTQNNLFLTGNPEGIADGCHPNEEGYRIYYVPQLIDLFERIIPRDTAQ